MTSLVRDLQRNALHNKAPLTDLLMKALFVARKLKITEFETWIKNELEGYSTSNDIPAYRKCYCQIKMYNPSHGWQAIVFSSREKEDFLNSTYIWQPISEIERIRELKSGEITMTLPSNLILDLQKSIGWDLPIERFDPLSYI